MVGLGCQAVTLELHKQKEQTETAWNNVLGNYCNKLQAPSF